MLGVSWGAAGGPAPAAVAVLARWQDATRQVDARLAALARELRSYDDVDFNQLADKGVHQLLEGRETSALEAAFAAYNAAGPDQLVAATAALRGAIADYRKFLDGSGLVEAIDDNPFDVSVEVYPTLNDALRRIDGDLSQTG